MPPRRRLPKRPAPRRKNLPRLKLQIAKALQAVQEAVHDLPGGGTETLTVRDRELLENIEDRLSGSLVTRGVTAADLMNVRKIAERIGINKA
jgi:hypothetical protein